MTRVTAVDIDTASQEECLLRANQYVVICGGDRYVANEAIHANGTTVVTIKTHHDEAQP